MNKTDLHVEGYGKYPSLEQLQIYNIITLTRLNTVKDLMKALCRH